MANITRAGRFTFDDATGALLVSSSAGGPTSDVNIKQIGGATVAMNNSLPVELSDGTNPFGTASNPLSVSGAKTNNNAAPGATNAGVLPAIANAAAPTWVEGNQVGLSSDLSGNQRSIISLNSFVSTQNSSTALLGSNGVFTGTSESILGFAAVAIEVFSDRASASSGLSIQQSQDGTNWDLAQTVTVAASTLLRVTVPAVGQFFRIVYTNTGSSQSIFRLQAIKQVFPGSVTVQGPQIPAGAATTTDPNPVVVGGKTTAATAVVVAGFSTISNGVGAQIVALPLDTYPEAAAITSYIGPSSTAAKIPPAAQVAVTSGSQTASVLLRTPNTFKTASVAATATGNSAVWTPTSGKKFRLMRFQITAQGLAATVSAAVTVSFQDSSTGITIGTYDVDVPAVAGIVSGIDDISMGWIDLGNGFLSAAANNVLNFNISAAGAGTVGTYRINVCGTEE